MTLKSPDCPLCGHPPAFVLAGEVQAFCGNETCEAMCWNPSETAAENLRGLKERQTDAGHQDEP